MTRVKPFSSAQLAAICKVIGNTDKGITGTQIQQLLQEISVPDVSPDQTKWRRLFNALADRQNTLQVGNHSILLINKVMNPVNFHNDKERFDWLRSELNVVLSFCGMEVNQNGKVCRATTETTISGARKRAGIMRGVLVERGVHSEVLKYCRAELIEENYFHAVLEATKGVAQRIREKSLLGTDGADLVNGAFGTKNPILKINALSNETEISEQRGFSNLLIGLFGAIRNPTAHAPRIAWPMPEKDALDILTFISFLHRKLDCV